MLADLGARSVAEDRIESRLASSFEGERGLEIEVGGTFFVPQVLSGEFESITASADSIRRDGLALRDVEIRFRTVEVSLSNLMDGKGALSVAGGSGSGSITERSLNAGLRRAGSDVVELGDTATVSTPEGTVEVDDVSVDGDTLTLSAGGDEVVSIPLPAPPAGVGYSDVRVSGGRLLLELDVPEGTLEL